MTHYARVMTIGLAVMATACNARGPHLFRHGVRSRSPSRDAMEHPRWDRVRGRVKYQLAKQQSEAGLFDEAGRTIAESITIDPTNPGAYVLLARVDLELGKPASAQQALDAAERAGLSSPELAYMEGVILEQRNQLETAVAKYAEARELDPNDIDYPVAQAECLVALDHPVEALALLDDITSAADGLDHVGTISLLAAHIAALIGDRECAAERYREAVVSAGDSPGAAMVAEELGLLLVRSGRCDEALSMLLPLLEKPSRGPATDPLGRIRRGLATCHLALNDSTSARHVLLEYARAHHTDTLAQLLLAKAAVGADDLLTALSALALAEEREPDHPEVKLVRATVQWKRGDLAAAAASLGGLLASTPDDVDAHCLMAEVLLAQGRPDAARKHLERALAIDPDCPWATAVLESLG